jgi:hypothetical protein
MKRISSGREELTTESGLADAVLDYAVVLAQASTADTITIPILREDGVVDEARLLLGPASQLTIVPDGRAHVDLPGSASITAELERRTASYLPRPIATDETDGSDGILAFPDLAEYS